MKKSYLLIGIFLITFVIIGLSTKRTKYYALSVTHGKIEVSVDRYDELNGRNAKNRDKMQEQFNVTTGIIGGCFTVGVAFLVLCFKRN